MSNTKTPSKFGPKDSRDSNVKQPGNNDSIASVIGAALFGNSGIQNSDKLASEGKKQGAIVDNINELVIGSKRAFDVDNKLQETTIDLKTSVTQSSDSLKCIVRFQESNNNLLQALSLITAHELDLVNQNIVSLNESLIKSVCKTIETVGLDITNTLFYHNLPHRSSAYGHRHHQPWHSPRLSFSLRPGSRPGEASVYLSWLAFSTPSVHKECICISSAVLPWWRTGQYRADRHRPSYS